MLHARATIVWLFAAVVFAQAQDGSIIPLDEVRPGMRGEGRTIFAGDAIETFDAEVLGVLENVGPRQSLIIVRLHGESIERTGVVAGMSGSPVYFEGRLAGAVAFSFPFAKEPIAGVRPIEDMLAEPAQTARPRGGPPSLQALLSGERPLLAGMTKSSGSGHERAWEPIASPVSFAGFTERTLEVFGDQFRALGMRPVQGAGGAARDGSEGPLQAGSMISVGLVRGALSISAAGTVTHVDGERIYAFGHRFLSAGPLQLPMMRSHVITTVPSLMNSFKLAGEGPVIGSITLDRSAGVAGRLGGGPDLVPIEVRVGSHKYGMEVVRDVFLTPFLLEVCAFAAIDATQREIGPQTLRMRGEARLQGAPPLRLDNIYAGPAGVARQAALGAAAPVAFVLQAAVEELGVESVEIEFEPVERERQVRLTRAWANREKARAGDDVELSVALRLPGGAEEVRRTEFRIPDSVPLGELFVTFSDAMRLNMLDFAVFFEASKLSTRQLVEAVNGLRRNDRLYLRIWRQQPGLRIQASRLNAPPASLRAILESAPGGSGSPTPEFSSALVEREVERFDAFVEGAETFRITITE